jgi:hypothetical protein
MQPTTQKGDDSHLIGSDGSRKQSLGILRSFLATESYDYQRIRGVYKIGKFTVVEKALDEHRKACSAEKVEFFADRTYRKLGLEGLTESLFSILAKDDKQKLERKLLKQKNKITWINNCNIILAYLGRLYRNQDKILICLAIKAIDISHEELQPLLASDIGRPSLKWIFKERSNVGVINWPTPARRGKPYLNRNEPIAFVTGLSEEEAFKLAQIRLAHAWDGNIPHRFWSILANFCGGHPNLLESVCNWLADVEIGGHWETVLNSEKSIVEELIHVAIQNQNEVTGIISVICADMSVTARTEVKAVVKGERDRIEKPAILAELRKAGLVLKDGRLSGIVHFFHPDIIKDNLRHLPAKLKNLDWITPSQVLPQEESNDSIGRVTTSNASETPPPEILSPSKLVSFLNETWILVFRSSFGRDRLEPKREKYEAALQNIQALSDTDLSRWVQKISTAKFFDEKHRLLYELLDAFGEVD